jgi:S-adenosylmethionine uptake transporter
MLAAALGFSTMAVMVKFASRGGDVSPFTVVLGRSVVVLTLSFALMRGRGIRLRPGNPRLLLWRCASGFTAMCCYFYALSVIPLANVVTIQYLSPIFVALFSQVTVKERVTGRLVVCAALAFGGILLMVAPRLDLGAVDPFHLVALASAILASFAYLAVRGLRTTDSPEGIVFWFSVFATLGSLPLQVFAKGWPAPWQVGAILGAGVFATVGQVCMTYAYRRAAAAWVSVFSYAAVVFSAIYGFVFFDEALTAAAIGGIAVVVVAGGLASRVRPKG